jgi:nitrite reductase/ring-hydroxylating ferredoxin subunit
MMKESIEKNRKIIEVAKTDEIPVGKTKHVEVNGKEIMIANVDGKYFALSDRCGHSSALLSMGSIDENLVTCPLHGAQFDLTTGKKIREPILIPPGLSLDNVPEEWKNFAQRAFEIASHIKTYDQEKYEVEVEGNSIRIVVPTSDRV